MTIALHPIKTDEEIHDVADMASSIWHEYWPAILTEAQLEYMVDTMQSFEAIKHAINQDGYRYYFIVDEARQRVGYTATHPEESERRLFISKIYLYASARGKHYASRVIDYYEKTGKEEGFKALYLTVNKHNELGCRAYRGRGFSIIDAVETDIGHGFIMDDYIMEKQLL
ncbi:MAG: GNAT family N-acetyltransferase [Raoultibacter sp.]